MTCSRGPTQEPTWGPTWVDSGEKENIQGTKSLNPNAYCTSEETGQVIGLRWASEFPKWQTQGFRRQNASFPLSYFLSLLHHPHPFFPSEFLSSSGVPSNRFPMGAQDSLHPDQEHVTQHHMSTFQDDPSNKVKFGASGKAMEFNTNNYAVC